jgi:hypothetical protein
MPDSDCPYVVMVDENSHYMDESERYEIGRYPDCATAIAVCKRIVDDFLATSGGGATTAAELFSTYTTFGEDPFIMSTDPACTFSGWDYARLRCAEILPP